MIYAILIFAAAFGADAVQVAPADPTAQFKWTGSSLKFDPSCRDFTLSTVQSVPECAARVAKLEPAPAAAIAARTLAGDRHRAGEAVDLLKRTAAAHDNPAVHYLLGSILGSAEMVRPEYASAVKHLAIASERGNPAASDLLASLLIAGKGGPRDVPRAIRLYETAAANGFPSAALRLGMLYLSGQHVAKDEARGIAWLDAAAKVEVRGASQLLAMARNQAKIHNFQLIPDADPAKVATVRYGTFDNPVIPPNFGFDLEFQKAFHAPYDDVNTLGRLDRDFQNLPTPYVYELARRLAVKDPTRALTLYLVARTRMTYDASRCADPAALEAVSAWDRVVAPDMRFLFRVPPSPAQIQQALSLESKFADTEPWWVCRSGMTAMAKAMEGNAGPLQLKPAAEWSQLRQASRAQLRM